MSRPSRVASMRAATRRRNEEWTSSRPPHLRRSELLCELLCQRVGHCIGDLIHVLLHLLPGLRLGPVVPRSELLDLLDVMTAMGKEKPVDRFLREVRVGLAQEGCDLLCVQRQRFRGF